MGATQKAFLALLGVAAFWGSGPLFFAALRDVPPFEVLCYRIIWGAVFYAIVLAVMGGFSAIPPMLKDAKTRRYIFAAALFLSANWLIFIYAVGNGHATESSIGYYILPLLNFVLAYVIFSERLSPMQLFAAGLAVLAVLILTLGIGRLPWVSVVIAASFAGYTAIKKAMPKVQTLPVVFVEAAVLVPFALIYLAFKGTTLGPQMWSSEGLHTHLLLLASGPITGIPLILFGYAAQRLTLSTIGFMSYLNPTLQLVCAAAILGEPLTIWHWWALGILWLAIASYTWVTLRNQPAA